MAAGTASCRPPTAPRRRPSRGPARRAGAFQGSRTLLDVGQVAERGEQLVGAGRSHEIATRDSVKPRVGPSLFSLLIHEVLSKYRYSTVTKLRARFERRTRELSPASAEKRGHFATRARMTVLPDG